MSDTIESTVEAAIERYLRFWNTAPDEQRRTGGDTFGDDTAYVAPAAVMVGVDALAEFTEQFAKHVGAYEFRARTAPDIHHDHARLPWEIMVGDTSFAEGTDVLAVGEDGRITSVAMFLDRAPDGFPDH